MGEQELRRLGDVAERLTHPSEHARHAGRIQPRVHQGVQADAVRLLFAGAAEAQRLALDPALRPKHRRHAGVAAASRADGDAGEQAGEPPRRQRPLRLELAGVVALAEMGELVRHHRRVLALVASVQKQAEVDADHAAGHRERVDLRAVDEHGRQHRRGERGVFGQPLHIHLHIVLENRIVDGGRTGADLPERRARQFAFSDRGHHTGGCVAQSGQARRRVFAGGRQVGHRRQRQPAEIGTSATGAAARRRRHWPCANAGACEETQRHRPVAMGNQSNHIR